MPKTRFALCTAILCLLYTTAAAETPKPQLLWPKGAPGAKGDTDADKPTLTIYLPAKDKATGAAVVICPGGGYGGLAMDHEGHQVAQWLNSLGVAGFILTYRHRGTGYGHPAPLLDAQRAIRTVRFHAVVSQKAAKTAKGRERSDAYSFPLRSSVQDWNINPDRIGILGFSAGGHLASTVGTHFDRGKADADDPIDRASCRPDFMVLVYPVISFTEWYAHAGSRKNLLGLDPDPKLVESFSNETRVTPETPPTFLVHTSGDTGVPAENSVCFYLALRKAKVPAEMHIFAKGEHGFGLGKKGEAVAVWPSLCAEWMRGRGLLDRK
jgi:acetyl esterase/lipase